MLKYIIKKVIPESVKIRIRSIKQERIQKFVSNLPEVDERYFANILRNVIGIKEGDIVFIHSSIDRINITFPFYRVLSLLREVLGKEGTMLFPTYPKVPSYKFLRSNETFDIRKSPSYTGILSEFARNQPKAIRSLHPTKSVCAIGPLAEELTNAHQNSPYPYDYCSPYYKLTEHNAKIIGIGVKTTYLSAVHAVDDALKENFPVMPYHKKLFEAQCINYDNETVIVKTYAHNMRKMNFDLPGFFKKHVPREICRDINIDGMNFFTAAAKPMIDHMVRLAKEKNITIYS